MLGEDIFRQINARAGLGEGTVFWPVGNFAGTDQLAYFPFKQTIARYELWVRRQARTIVARDEASPPSFFASPFCLYSSFSRPSPLIAYDYAPSGMASTSSPWQKPSRFKEHLSISPSDNLDIERSRFSLDSPPLHPPRTASLTLAGTPSSFMNTRDIPEDVESLRSHGSNVRRQTIRDRFTKIFFDVRTLDDRSHSHDIDLISVRPLSPWAPLNLDKEKSTSYPAPRHPPPQKKQKKRFRWWMLLLILIILALLGDIAFLNARVLELTKVINRNTPSSPTPAPSNSSSSDDVQECLSQFTLDAPSNPSAYPCSTCLPILSNVTDNANATNATQFCGLRAILESTSTTGLTALSNGGWGKDLNVCTWSGVSCSGSGLVTSL